MKNSQIKIHLNQKSPTQWVEFDAPVHPNLAANCTADRLEKALAHEFDGITVQSVELVETFERYLNTTEGYDTEQLKHYRVTIDHQFNGLSVRHWVYLPLHWNQRFLACAGGGMRTFEFPAPQTKSLPFAAMYPIYAVLNGFASADSDGGVKLGGSNPVTCHNYALREDGSIAYEEIQQLAYINAQQTARIAKIVIQTAYGESPIYSYMQGASNGGRMTMMQMQMFPEEFDGFWAADPALYWTQLFASYLWPVVVMNEEKHIVTSSKFDAVFECMLKASNSPFNFIDSVEDFSFDFDQCLGTESCDGPITEEDIHVIKKIYAGPQTVDGHSLCKGYKYGAKFWKPFEDMGFPYGNAIEYVQTEHGLTVHAVDMVREYFGCWVEQDKNWSDSGLGYESFERLFFKGMKKFAFLTPDDPYIRRLKENGGKLILTHNYADTNAPSNFSIDYYNRVSARMGGEDDVNNYFRFFLFPGGGHVSTHFPGYGVTLASGMYALMKWVEEGIAPEALNIEESSMTFNLPVRTAKVPFYQMGGENKVFAVTNH